MSAPIVIRIVILAVLVAALEALSRLGIIDRFTMPAPSRILTELVKLLASGAMWPNIAKTMGNVAVACTSAIVVGVVTGATAGRDCVTRSIRYSRPITPCRSTPSIRSSSSCSGSATDRKSSSASCWG